MIKLALLRHGHTDWNRQGRIQGRTDIPLDQAAAEDLGKLALPQEWQKAHICASPLSRAMETARLVSGRDAAAEPALLEMNWGDWEGEKAAELRQNGVAAYKDIEDWGWNYTPPNGESPSDLRCRLEPWLQQLGNDTVAVCHIGVMRVLLALATGWNFDGPAPFQVKRNRLFVLDIKDGIPTLRPEPIRLLSGSL